MSERTEILIAGRDKIMQPEHWTKGTAKGKNWNGEVTYCAAGAVFEQFTEVGYVKPVVDALNALRIEAHRRGYGSVPHLNDDWKTTHADILDLYDSAITRSKQEDDLDL